MEHNAGRAERLQRWAPTLRARPLSAHGYCQTTGGLRGHHDVAATARPRHEGFRARRAGRGPDRQIAPARRAPSICSAWRSTNATIVRVGLQPPAVGKTLPSEMKRLGTSCAWP